MCLLENDKKFFQENVNLKTMNQIKFNIKNIGYLSFILGIFNAIIFLLILITLIFHEKLGTTMILEPLAPFIVFLIIVLIPILSVAGIMCGIFGLKSTKKKFAITGSLLCAVELLVSLILFLFS